jgi:hypothetical protein
MSAAVFAAVAAAIARPSPTARVLGEDHPQTKIVRGNLAVARQQPQ